MKNSTIELWPDGHCDMCQLSHRDVVTFDGFSESVSVCEECVDRLKHALSAPSTARTGSTVARAFSQADARLIAAAPEMYALLQRYVRSMMSPVRDEEAEELLARIDAP